MPSRSERSDLAVDGVGEDARGVVRRCLSVMKARGPPAPLLDVAVEDVERADMGGSPG
jgi:hypothetical protein